MASRTLHSLPSLNVRISEAWVASKNFAQLQYFFIIERYILQHTIKCVLENSLVKHTASCLIIVGCGMTYGSSILLFFFKERV